jgi:hypothetical protein
MPQWIVMEEFHLTVYDQHGLPVPEHDAIQQTFNDAYFQARLRRAVRRAFRREALLRKTKVRLSR